MYGFQEDMGCFTGISYFRSLFDPQNRDNMILITTNEVEIHAFNTEVSELFILLN